MLEWSVILVWHYFDLKFILCTCRNLVPLWRISDLTQSHFRMLNLLRTGWLIVSPSVLTKEALLFIELKQICRCSSSGLCKPIILFVGLLARLVWLVRRSGGRILSIGQLFLKKQLLLDLTAGDNFTTNKCRLRETRTKKSTAFLQDKRSLVPEVLASVHSWLICTDAVVERIRAVGEELFEVTSVARVDIHDTMQLIRWIVVPACRRTVELIPDIFVYADASEPNIQTGDLSSDEDRIKGACLIELQNACWGVRVLVES